MEEILKERLISNAEALEILKETSKEIELGYEQKNAFEHLKKYTKISEKNAIELIEKLKEISKLTERQVISIVNLLPKDRDEVRVILDKDYKNLTEEEKALILEKVNKFV